MAFSGTVAADHLFATDKLAPNIAAGPNRINLLFPVCFDGTTDLSYDAETGFFVAHGWSNGPWGDLTPLEKRAYASKATKFELSIDGELQKSAMHSGMVRNDIGEKFRLKTFVIEDHDGLSGDHTFTGRWYFDASDPFFGGEKGVPLLLLECTFTVHFA